jgi:hypothetical protein
MISDPEFHTYDYVIGGKMVVGKAVLTESYYTLMMSDSEAKLKLKETLIHQMATYMLEHKLVEFTQYKDALMGQTHVAVRAYLAPNDQVKILRVANKIV